MRTSIPDAAEIEARRAKSKPSVNPAKNPPTMSPQAARPNQTKSEAEFNTGDKVMHAKFGQGIVMSSKLTGADEEVTIAFTSAGVKRLVASLAKLEKV